MELKPGSRWKSAVCDTEAVVVRPPKGEATLECGGAPMLPHTADKAAGGAVAEAHSAGSLLGKRYEDAESGVELLCTKGGAGSLSVSGRPVVVKEAKKLPSSD